MARSPTSPRSSSSSTSRSTVAPATCTQLLARLNTLVTGLNAHTDDIDRVLDGMDRLGSALAADAPSLSRAIDDLTPAITTLQRRSAPT